MKRIVVGIDGSDQGWSALAKAAEMASATGAALQIVHVSSPRTPQYAAENFQVEDAAWIAAEKAWSQGLLRDASARVQVAGLEVISVSKHGTPAETIAELAQLPEVTMVVIGHRGRNLAARLLIGSVADRLVQISPKAVLVVR